MVAIPVLSGAFLRVVAGLLVDRIGAKLTKLTDEQAHYFGVGVGGPYKPDHYRY